MPGIDHDGQDWSMTSEIDREIIKLPTAHIIGLNDPQAYKSIELSKTCDYQNRNIASLTHGYKILRKANAVSEWRFVFQRSLKIVVCLKLNV
jgi:hypothetical protein